MSDLLSKERLVEIIERRSPSLRWEEAPAMAKELLQRRDAEKKPVHNWQDEFTGACRTLATITELLDIPADDVNGEPSQIFDAIEALKSRLTAYDMAAKEPVVLPDYMLAELEAANSGLV